MELCILLCQAPLGEGEGCSTLQQVPALRVKMTGRVSSSVILPRKALLTSVLMLDMWFSSVYEVVILCVYLAML